MKLRQRLGVAYKILASQELGNSLGTVIRNYGRGSSFSPHDQVRGITYKAIDKIGLSLSTYRPIVRKRNGEAYENHPLYKLFDQPNPRRNGTDFIHLYGMLFEIYGENFIYIAKGEVTGSPKELYLLPPSQVELKIFDGDLVGYVLHKADGTQVPLEIDEVIHDMRPNPFNEWRGMSVLERAAVYVDTEITTSVFTLNYMRNNASPSGIVSLPNMDTDAFKLFTERWREGYEGPENAGKTAFIRGEEAHFKAVGATLKDVDQEITRKMSKDDVLMMFEVPKPLLGMTDEAGFGRGNLEVLKTIYAEQKIDPMMSRLDGVYLRLMKGLPRVEDAIITHISPVPEDKEFKLKTYEKGVNVWLTANEVREEQGLKPIDGGDEIIPGNRPGQAQRVTTESFKKKIVLRNTSKAEQTKKINQEQEDFRTNLVKTNEVYERKVKATISEFARNQEKTVISKINATSKAYEEWLFSIKEESAVMAEALLPIILELVEAQAEDVTHFITGETVFVTDELRAKVQADILKISGLFNEDTIAALEKTITEGNTAGESLVKLKKRVETVYSEAKGYRAERIARTESLKASNNTAESVYKANGFSKVQWFTNPGACQWCRTFEGRTKEIGSSFINIGDVVIGDNGDQLRIEYDNITVPPLHPNCTCSLVPA